jgi:hypothetical protein
VNFLFWSVWAATCCADNPEASVAPAGDVGPVAELLTSSGESAETALAPFVGPKTWTERWIDQPARDVHEDHWHLAPRGGLTIAQDSREPDEDIEFDEGRLGAL